MNLAVLPTSRLRAHEKTVEILEQWLERARRGEITQVALAGVCADGGVAHQHSPTDDFFVLIGAVEAVKFDMLRGAFEL